MKRLSLPLAWWRGIRSTTRIATVGSGKPQRRSAATTATLERVHIGAADRENVGAGGCLHDLVFGDAWIGAEHMTESDGGHRN